MRLEYKRRYEYLLHALNGIDGIQCAESEGAFYAFPKIENNKYSSDKEFVTKLLESQGVLTVHGSGFGEKYGSGYFRLVYLPSMEILESAMNKIERFVSQ